jgi:hypothetical protein
VAKAAIRDVLHELTERQQQKLRLSRGRGKRTDIEDNESDEKKRKESESKVGARIVGKQHRLPKNKTRQSHERAKPSHS